MRLDRKNILITGAAQRIGHSLALATAQAGANIILHYHGSEQAARATQAEIESLGRNCYLLRADLSDAGQTQEVIERATRHGPLYALVNNASLFEPLTWDITTLEDWNRILMVNLTAPFLLSQAFGRAHSAGEPGRILNLLDWRVLRPGADHLPYTISKAALAALTRSLAVALAPHVTVNGLAFGAILPPSDGAATPDLLRKVPAGRWADLEEVNQAALFLLDGPAYITGEIIHLDGGRHLI